LDNGETPEFERDLTSGKKPYKRFDFRKMLSMGGDGGASLMD
jgi:hypothetical protein